MTSLDYRSQTVLVTGASSGIGAEFARQLAARGANAVLVARRQDRLDALATELTHRHHVKATAIALDLTTPNIGSLLDREVTRRGIEITSVVNNAGFATHGLFHEEHLDRLTAEIALDVTSVVEISHRFIERLRRRGDGFLINVASMAAYQANPTMAVYGATKAFVLNFTEALWYESRGTGLRVLALSPGATQTEFFDVAGSGADGGARRMSAADVVSTALAALDRRNPPPSVIAGRVNRAAAAGSRLISRRRATMIIGAMMRDSTTVA
ncbi:SDR family oxidoreductase [Micromonospora sp. WMMD1082]|uniref:SDR family NAD(P)-dependent oxidoreductase n=1 Tax=Micromonospora sp. WMMD1082 TaxID=3016104 RepID=UPI0024172CE6|nr:SDR family oxidoreductase [Micromonospora sp. WMMD1082]MDG4798012.1 SDR family oxidoreductase [Micromonospora sp. WMMD1082]